MAGDVGTSLHATRRPPGERQLVRSRILRSTMPGQNLPISLAARGLARTAPLSVRTALVLLLAAALLAVAAASLWLRATGPSDGTRAGYVSSSLSRDGLEISPQPGADTSLTAGDRVRAINGTSLEAWIRGSGGHLDAAVGGELTYLISRGDASVEVRVPLVPYPVAQLVAESCGTLFFCVVMFAVAAYVYARRPREAAARALLVLGSGLVGSTVPWVLGFQALDIADGIGFWLWLVATFGVYGACWSAALHFALVFPRRLRVLDRLPGGAAAIYLAWPAAVVGWLVGATLASGSLLEALGSATSLQLLLVLAIVLAVIGLVVIQYRTARDPVNVQQMRWIAWGGGISASFSALFWFGPELIAGEPLLPWNAAGISGLVFPAAIAVAVLRHRLFDIDVVINRTLVYGGLTGAVVSAYVASVALLGVVLRGEGAFAASLLATGMAALAALPVRDRLQRGVNRLMYGDRDDPYRAITRLEERLSQSLTLEEVLPTVVATVSGALRLPYVAIELASGDITTIAAATGESRGVEQIRLPLVDHGELIGALIVAPRGTGETFSQADRELLAGLAREAGKAARSVRLATEVERSRRQLVAAREEERRRLRRDLHDGLGPTLAGARLKLEAARALADPRASDAASLLDQLDTDLASVLDDVRRISRGLRPPALDELGLMPALRAQAAAFSVDAGLELRVEGPDDLPPLPAAIEAAAYRIVLEALTNVRRHSGAAQCAVRVRLGDGLEVEVEDDGIGISAGTPRGVGLTAMRERASEVGGSCDISRTASTGTRVLARLPLPTG